MVVNDEPATSIYTYTYTYTISPFKPHRVNCERADEAPLIKIIMDTQQFKYKYIIQWNTG